MSSLKKKPFVIDVGANSGDFSIDILTRNNSVQVLAIEPIVELCSKIRSRAKDLDIPLDRLTVLPCAIDIYEGKAVFNVSEHDDRGVSGLLNFSKEIQDNEYWKLREDLYFDKQTVVEVKRLDSILGEMEVDQIDFVKIDAQGVDLNVLLSLGHYTDKTIAGMLEIAAISESKLYEGELYSLRDALNTLTDFGFKIFNIKPNDFNSNEFNVFFCRNDIDHRFIEEQLKLKGIPLYDGKHFWHSPSSSYQPNQNINVTELLEEFRGEKNRYVLELKRYEDLKLESDKRLEDLLNERESYRAKLQSYEDLKLESDKRLEDLLNERECHRAKLQSYEDIKLRSDIKINELLTLINNMERSMSWRLTMPLRNIRQFFNSKFR